MMVVVAVLGGGKIGEAVGRSIAKSDKVSKVIITRRNLSKSRTILTHPLSREDHQKKIEFTTDNKHAAEKSDLIIIAVKAGDAKQVLEEISKSCKDKIVISLMAAITIKRLENSLPEAKLVRAMPNIAAVIGEAITAYSLGRNLTKQDEGEVKFVLESFGDSIEVQEPLMDAVTGLSGSGPGYIAVLIEAMVSAGLKVGLPRDVAFKLVTKTLTGTANLLESSKVHPAELRDTVTTPAGTTIAGIYELEKGSFRTSIMNAVEAATMAAEKVAKKFDSEP
jgi:pyrroline-5-carboxylate reductase